MRQNRIDSIGYVAALALPYLSAAAISLLVLTLRFDRNVIKEITGL